MHRIFIACLAALALFGLTPALAQANFEDLLQTNAKLIKKSSSKTVGPVLEQLQQYGGEAAESFLTDWQAKKLHYIRKTGRFVLVEKAPESADDKKQVMLRDAVTGVEIGLAPAKSVKQIKPNSGVRAKIAATLVPFQLGNPDPAIRETTLKTLLRDIQPSHLAPLQAAIAAETLPDLKDQMRKAYVFGVLAHGTDEREVVTAINGLAGDLSLDVRAALTPLLASSITVAMTLPDDANIARIIIPGRTTRNTDGTAGRISAIGGADVELTVDAAYAMLAGAGLAPAFVTGTMRDEVLVAAVIDGMVGSFALAELDNDASRDAAYQQLVDQGRAPQLISDLERQQAVQDAVFHATYDNPSTPVTDAARTVLNGIQTKVALYKYLDLLLDALSLASIYFLAAIGLAITFGVMRVINMAHGEFIMMGAYTGYVVQLFVPNYTLSIAIAVPAAFLVTFCAGVLMERLVIRHLYKRPLETLLATFGISIALQQLAKNIFGTQARPLTAPGWLDGAFAVNDVLAISNIRIAIFCLALIFLGLLVYVMRRTRFGLETRTVTQNPAMAASMGINPDRINMLTFGFGSGIAGIAGVAIGLYSKVTSELGADYIVQSFMTVVVGGVGNIWGTLAGAAMIGSLQKGIEWFNPSNTLAAQTYMIIFIILFIQFRPRGIIAQRGRAVEA
ncbi:MAG: urea ABC transporter permease subunit UrtB [Candidatus Puniceispirillaceae bacterium]